MAIDEAATGTEGSAKGLSSSSRRSEAGFGGASDGDVSEGGAEGWNRSGVARSMECWTTVERWIASLSFGQRLDVSMTRRRDVRVGRLGRTLVRLTAALSRLPHAALSPDVAPSRPDAAPLL